MTAYNVHFFNLLLNDRSIKYFSNFFQQFNWVLMFKLLGSPGCELNQMWNSAPLNPKVLLKAVSPHFRTMSLVNHKQPQQLLWLCHWIYHWLPSQLWRFFFFTLWTIAVFMQKSALCRTRSLGNETYRTLPFPRLENFALYIPLKWH